ncbi:MAG TPA: copper chaperone PCu(A)C [Anaerolineales bacterium]|nr:copper chaperone PCu(A)C [Anaerolineales bacterium]
MKLRLAFLIIIAFIITACAPASNDLASAIQVGNPWVRTVNTTEGMGGSTTALFMKLQNNTDTPDMLLEAESDIADMVQIHLSEIDANGVSSMHEVQGVEIPANGSVELKPGSYHIMVMGLKQMIKEGDTVTFSLTFQKAGTITVEAPVKAP